MKLNNMFYNAEYNNLRDENLTKPLISGKF